MDTSALDNPAHCLGGMPITLLQSPGHTFQDMKRENESASPSTLSPMNNTTTSTMISYCPVQRKPETSDIRMA